jgi:hypothetical protein
LNQSCAKRGSKNLFQQPAIAVKLEWQPVHLAIERIRQTIGDANEKEFWPVARLALRRAAYGNKVRIRGRKQFEQKSISKGDYSDLHTDIDSQYWTGTVINVLATSDEGTSYRHVDPETAFSWGPKGMDERKGYAELLVNSADIQKEWP